MAILSPAMRSSNCARAAVIALFLLTQLTCEWPPHQVGFIRIYETNPFVKQLVVGPDGNVWFIANAKDSTDNVIARMTPNGRTSSFTHSGDFFLRINGLAISDGGIVWFTATQVMPMAQPVIYRMSPDGTQSTFYIPTPRAFSEGIVATPDGGAWFVETSTDKVGHVTADGKITEFAIPHNPQTRLGPWGIAIGPDGNIWTTLSYGDAIARITPMGEITQFPVPTKGSRPLGIAAGPDGNIWFTETTADKIVRATPSGKMTEFSSPEMRDHPHTLATGRENDLWFCETGWMGRITVDGQVSVRPNPGPSTCSSIVEDKTGTVWMTLNFGPGRWKLAGPQHGAVAKFSASEWPK